MEWLDNKKTGVQCASTQNGTVSKRFMCMDGMGQKGAVCDTPSQTCITRATRDEQRQKSLDYSVHYPKRAMYIQTSSMMGLICSSLESHSSFTSDALQGLICTSSLMLLSFWSLPTTTPGMCGQPTTKRKASQGQGKVLPRLPLKPKQQTFQSHSTSNPTQRAGRETGEERFLRHPHKGKIIA